MVPNIVAAKHAAAVLRKSVSIDSIGEAQYGYPTPSDIRER